MTKDELVKLAERCEAASGPDRELDREIALTFGHPWDYAADWGPRGHDRPTAFPYTASIDAAMTLVPEGPGRGCFAMSRDRFKRTHCSVWTDAEFNRKVISAGATPALALCAAALRARATTTGEAK
jgi:hypothetical protein